MKITVDYQKINNMDVIVIHMWDGNRVANSSFVLDSHDPEVIAGHMAGALNSLLHHLGVRG
jgi:hypothetical protein